MKLLITSLILFAVTFGGQVAMDHYDIGETFHMVPEVDENGVPVLDESGEVREVEDKSMGHIRAAWAVEVHDMLKPAYQVAASCLFFALIDLVWLPWLKIKDVVFGLGKFEFVPAAIRASITAGYIAAWCTMIFAFRM